MNGVTVLQCTLTLTVTHDWRNNAQLAMATSCTVSQPHATSDIHNKNYHQYNIYNYELYLSNA